MSYEHYMSMIDDKIIKNANLAELYTTIPQHLSDFFQAFNAEQQDNKKENDDDQPPPLIDVSDEDHNEDETNDHDKYLHYDLSSKNSSNVVTLNMHIHSGQRNLPSKPFFG